MKALRGLTFLVGVGLLAATAHVTISMTGGYGAPHAVLTMAIALGVGVGALAIGSAWSARRVFLSAWLVLAILAGEAFGMLVTAERLIVGREAAQAPLRDAEKVHAKASARVTDAASTFESMPASSPRLEAAIAAKAAADAVVVAKSAKRGCAKNCRALLQAQVDAANAEIVTARAEVTDRREAAERELASARTILAGISVPASATPLADRLGWPAWVIDLVTAALGSMAANGLGCGLIAFAAHSRARAPVVELVPVEHTAQFAIEALAPAKDDAADLIDIHGAYRDWCRKRGVEALPADKIGAALATLFDGAGIEVSKRDGRKVALGVAVKGQPVKVLGRMATVGAAKSA